MYSAHACEHVKHVSAHDMFKFYCAVSIVWTRDVRNVHNVNTQVRNMKKQWVNTHVNQHLLDHFDRSAPKPAYMRCTTDDHQPSCYLSVSPPIHLHVIGAREVSDNFEDTFPSCTHRTHRTHDTHRAHTHIHTTHKQHTHTHTVRTPYAHHTHTIRTHLATACAHTHTHHDVTHTSHTCTARSSSTETCLYKHRAPYLLKTHKTNYVYNFIDNYIWLYYNN